jgi:hypothetical protein
VDDASTRARDTRERADADAVQRVSQAEEATERMLERTNGVEGEIDRLLSEMRAAAGNLVENLRSSATSLNQELTSIREEYAVVRGGRLESDAGGGGAAAVAEPEEAAPEAVEDAGPVDAEPEVVTEVREVEETAAYEAPAEDEYSTAEEPAAAVAEPEPEPEPEEEEAPAEAEAPAEPARGGRSIRGAEGARLIALNMALNGTPRDETARYLSQNFDLDDQDSLLDEVYARVGG